MMQSIYTELKYVLTEEEYSQLEASDLFLKRFAASFGKLIKPYENTLTTSNYEHTVSFLVEQVCRDFERWLANNCRFNQLGAVQLDKDIRSLTAYLTNNTPWTDRSKMTRLNQFSTIVNVESVSEILEYWGPKSGPISWRYSAAEVRKVLALRIEFTPDEISRLKL
jgi:conserved oligomeric Golgi complex subunit 4